MSTKDFAQLCRNAGLDPVEQIRKMGLPAEARGGRNKYGVDQSPEGRAARACDGILFDSKAEMRHYQALKIAAQAGMVSGLELQPKFLLQEKFTDTQGRKHRASFYVADFSFTREGKRIVVDVKSKPTQTPQFRIKWKIVNQKFPEIVWEMWT